jgi:hypothetical protein
MSNSEVASTSSPARKEEDMAAVLKSTLQQLQQRFHTLADKISGRIDYVAGGIDELEKTLEKTLHSGGSTAADRLVESALQTPRSPGCFSPLNRNMTPRTDKAHVWD